MEKYTMIMIDIDEPDREREFLLDDDCKPLACFKSIFSNDSMIVFRKDDELFYSEINYMSVERIDVEDAIPVKGDTDEAFYTGIITAKDMHQFIEDYHKTR